MLIRKTTAYTRVHRILVQKNDLTEAKSAWKLKSTNCASIKEKEVREFIILKSYFFPLRRLMSLQHYLRHTCTHPSLFIILLYWTFFNETPRTYKKTSPSKILGHSLPLISNLLKCHFPHKSIPNWFFGKLWLRYS